MTVDRLLAHRLLFVTGKGGVGRTTVAAVLGLLAAGRGLRTIVATVGGRDDLPGLLAHEGEQAGAGTAGAGAAEAETPQAGADEAGADEAGAAAEERELSPGLFSIGIDPQRAMDEYLRDQLPIAALADLLGSSRSFGYLAAATPGLRELLTIGKVWELAQPQRRKAGGRRYDLVIVDAPATGYGISLLSAPRTFSKIARRGPISRHGAAIHATLVDPRTTGVVAVGTAAEPAVNEILETRARLTAELGIELAAVIVNALRPRRLAGGDRPRLEAVLAEDPTPGVRRAVSLALAEDAGVRVERDQLRRLTAGLRDRPVELPFVYSEQLGRSALIGLAELLERSA